MKDIEDGDVLGFDYGEVRTGVARANLIAKLPEPLETLDTKKGLWKKIDEFITEYRPVKLVVGLPRNMNGQETDQSVKAREFARALRKKTGLETVMQDESLTSVDAERSLRDSRSSFDKSEVDMFAAVTILDDYLRAMTREI